MPTGAAQQRPSNDGADFEVSPGTHALGAPDVKNGIFPVAGQLEACPWPVSAACFGVVGGCLGLVKPPKSNEFGIDKKL